MELIAIQARRRTGLDIESQRRARNAELEARLRNWGLVYRGGWPKCALSRNGTDEYPTLDELDAAVLERALVDLRARKYHLFRLARLIYVADKPDVVLCSIFRCGGRSLFRKKNQLFRWLDFHLTG